MNIEQPMPPWGPRYEPIDPICHGMGKTDVHDSSTHGFIDVLEELGVLDDEERSDLLLRSLS